MLALLLEHTPHRFEHDHDGGLVVRSEDRSRRVAHDPVLADDRVDPRLGRHRVGVRAEEDRRPGVRRGRDTGVDVPSVTAEPFRGVVLVVLEPDLSEVRRDTVGDGALTRRGTRDRAQLEEEVEEPRPQRLLDGVHRRHRTPLGAPGRNT